MKVAFAGAPDTGKTTLAKLVSSRFNLNGSKVHYVSEYAREFVTKFGDAENVAEQYYITRRQQDMEPVLGKNDFLFTDAPDFLAYIYSVRLANLESPKDKAILSDILSLVLPVKYDLVFFTKPFREVFDDGIRTKFVPVISELDEAIQSFFVLYKIPYLVLSDTNLYTRCDKVESIIKGRLA
jgi:nicotinamide riboside kinase